MKRHKSISPMLRNRDLSFWTPVNFEVEYFFNEETEGVLTDTVIYFSDQHLTWLSQLKPNAKVGICPGYIQPLLVPLNISSRISHIGKQHFSRNLEELSIFAACPHGFMLTSRYSEAMSFCSIQTLCAVSILSLNFILHQTGLSPRWLFLCAPHAA